MVAPNKLSLTSKDFLVIWSPIYYKNAFLNEKIGQEKKRKWIFLFCVFRVEQWSNFVSFSACWFWRWYVWSLCIIAWRILSFPVCWLLKEAAVHLMRWTSTSCLKGFFFPFPRWKRVVKCQITIWHQLQLLWKAEFRMLVMMPVAYALNHFVIVILQQYVKCSCSLVCSTVSWNSFLTYLCMIPFPGDQLQAWISSSVCPWMVISSCTIDEISSIFVVSNLRVLSVLNMLAYIGKSLNCLHFWSLIKKNAMNFSWIQLFCELSVLGVCVGDHSAVVSLSKGNVLLMIIMRIYIGIFLLLSFTQRILCLI